MSRRHYVNEAPVTALTAAVDSAATSIPVASLVGMPSVLPYTAEIDGGTASAEVVLVTAVIGSTATVSRAFNGTSAQTHNGGATFQHVAVAMDFDEANSHVNSTTGVHGVTGTIVGTTQAQTITNKSFQNNVHITGAGVDAVPGVDIATVAGPGIALQARAGFTINASLTGAGALTLNSTLTVAGATALQALTATTVTTTGAATVGGALTVGAALAVTTTAAITGAVTLGATLNVLGATTLGALTANSLTLGTTPVTTYTACLSTARPAAPILGALIYETDTGLSYRWDGTVWRVLSLYAEVTRNSPSDDSSRSDIFSGTADLASLLMVDAPAGVYEVVGHATLASPDGAAAAGGYMKLLCTSGTSAQLDVNLNARDDFINARGVHAARPYVHAGGDLRVKLSFTPVAALGSVRVLAWGTYVNVKRVI